MKDSRELFEENLKKYLDSLPYDSVGLSEIDASCLQFCETLKGELNLKTVGETQEAYECEEGALEWWRKEWKQQVLIFYDIVICYGLGLGYLVEVADVWLREFPKIRKLIIIEDDPKVIVRFLESARAKSVLEHPQVKIVHIRAVAQDDHIISQVLRSCAVMPYHFRHLLFMCLPYYSKMKEREYKNLKAQVYYLKEVIDRGRESIYYIQDIVYNHLKNLQHLPEAYDICKEPGIFKDLPAIICGGGSSLEDELSKLEDLQDRALIVGVGAGISVLSEAGIRPHLCCGLDPTMKHTARVMVSAQFEVPFLYSTRMQYRGLELLQAPLMVTFHEGKDEAQWLFEKLNLHSGRTFSGVGVGNYACNYLQLMGCNPLMVLGIDLAHTKGKPYAEGFKQHPLAAELKQSKSLLAIEYVRDISEEEKEKFAEEEEYLKLSTTSQFFLEAKAYGEFAEKYPETTFINLSMIGTKINNFKKMPIEEATKKFLQKTNDISSLIHGRIIQSKLDGVNRERISVYYQEWIQHVEEAHDTCQKIHDEVNKFKENYPEEKEVPKEIEEKFGQFLKNPCYEYLFRRYLNYYREMEKCRLEWWPSEESKLELMSIRCSYLVYLSTTALEFFKKIKGDIDVPQESARPRFPALEGVADEKPGEGDLYSLKDGVLTLVDWDLDLSYHEPFNPLFEENAEEKIERIFYPSGAIEFEQHRKGEKLHGPTIYYGMNGQILSTAWYIEGVKQGKAWRYYPSGALYAVERFRNGKREGKQEYFFESGVHRTIMPFNKGILHGDIVLYHPNGIKKRLIQFKEGKRDGEEKIWDANTTLRGEMHYVNDVPSGNCYAWYEDGSRQLEIIYWQPGKLETIEEWNGEGERINKEVYSGSRMIHQVQQMIHQLDGLQDKLQQVASHMPPSGDLGALREALPPEKKAEFERLEQELQKLKKLFGPK